VKRASDQLVVVHVFELVRDVRGVTVVIAVSLEQVPVGKAADGVVAGPPDAEIDDQALVDPSFQSEWTGSARWTLVLTKHVAESAIAF